MSIIHILLNTIQDDKAGRNSNITYLVKSSTACEPYPDCNRKTQINRYDLKVQCDKNMVEPTQFPML